MMGSKRQEIVNFIIDDQAISPFLYNNVLAALEIDMKVWGIMAKAYPELLRTPLLPHIFFIRFINKKLKLLRG
jgi:hypothetical protein